MCWGSGDAGIRTELQKGRHSAGREHSGDVSKFIMFYLVRFDCQGYRVTESQLPTCGVTMPTVSGSMCTREAV